MLKRLRQLYIGDKNFYKMVIAIALPVMVQNFITHFVGLLDNIMVGNVGTDQMTGVAIANQVIFIFNLGVFGAVTGAGIFGAQYFGKGDHVGVRYAFRFKIIAAVLITALATGAFILFGDEIIMSYLKGEGEVENIEAALAYGKEYLLIMLLGFLPYAIMSCYAGTLRESRETLLPMKAGVIAVLTNLCLNAILIFGLFGLPAMGVAGAAWATVISRFVEFFIVVIWTHKNRAKHPFIVGAFRSLYIPLHTAFDIFKKALPLTANESLWALGVALLNQCYSMRGYDVVSAVNISNTIANLFCVSFMSLGTAVGIIAGQQLGAGETERAVDSARKLMVFAVATSIVFGGLLAIAAPLFPMLYKTEPSIQALATAMIFLRVGHMPIYSIAHTSYYTIRAGGRTFITVLFDSVYALGIVYPVALLLATFTDLPILTIYFISQYIEIGKAILGLALVSNRRVWVRNLVDGK